MRCLEAGCTCQEAGCTCHVVLFLPVARFINKTIQQVVHRRPDFFSFRGLLRPVNIFHSFRDRSY